MARIGRHFVAMCWVVVALFIADLAYGYISEYFASGSTKIVVDVAAIVVLFWLGSVYNGYRISCMSKASRSQKCILRSPKGFMNTPDEKMVKDSNMKSNSMHG